MNERPTEAETTVRYTYWLSPADSGVCAECVEVDAAGEGKTREEAVEALREALREILGASEALASVELFSTRIGLVRRLLREPS